MRPALFFNAHPDRRQRQGYPTGDPLWR